MSDIINNLLLTDTPTSTSVVKTNEQGVKETPSLFDSLLSSVLPKEANSEAVTTVPTKSVETADIKTEKQNVEEVKIDTTLNQIVEKSEIKEVVVEENKEESQKQNNTTTSSLLDKLVLEAKKDLDKTNSKDALLNKIEQTIVVPEEISVETADIKTEKQNVEEVKIDTTLNQIVEKSEIKEVVVEENKEESQKQNNTTTSSLLDKLVLEAKKDLDKTNSKDALLNKIEQTIVVPEEISVETADIKTEKQNVEEVKIDTTLNQIVEKSEIKEVVVEENKEESQKQNNTTTSSLLDKLVLEAKKDLDKTNSKDALLNKIEQTIVVPEEISVETADIKTEKQNVEEVKIDTTLNQIVEKSEIKEVVVEENKEESQKQNNTTTSSLLDKLVLEAKKDLDKTNSKDALLNKIDQTIVVPEEISVETADIKTEKQNVEEVKIDISRITIDTIISSENEVLVSDVETISVIENEELSLMDKLIQKTTEKIVTTNTTNDIAIETSTKQIASEDLITNIYLGSQKNQFSNQSLFNKKEAMTLLKEGSSVEAIKVSAEMLELGLENVDIQQTKDNKLEIKKTTIDVVDRKNLIENLLAQKNVKSDEIKNLITQSVEASKALLENELTLAEDSIVNVNSPLSYNIQSKIIGAKQQMATMMSDIARQMYENYKPPVTAFRINLNPTELGSIAILMKNDKNSGLSISMNVSNSVTLDTLMENQNVLKNSLNKTFNENTRFDLDFTSSNGNSNNQSSNNQDNQQDRRFEQQIDTQSILQLQEENKDREEKVIDYM